ncbi:MAG: DUF2971 domain-containing protein [Burkholderiales bacterium]
MEGNELRRYTSLASILHTLRTGNLVLLSPKLWEDRNDSYYIEAYRQRSELAAVLALCLTEAAETYHHWKVFAGEGGGCIVLHKASFIDHVRRGCGLPCQKVQYRTHRQMDENGPPKDGDLPYLKRHAFRHEIEWRVIYEDSAFADHMEQDLPLPFTLIDRIVLNPWMPVQLALSVAEVIRQMSGCGDLKVVRSALIDNETWKGKINLDERSAMP